MKIKGYSSIGSYRSLFLFVIIVSWIIFPYEARAWNRGDRADSPTGRNPRIIWTPEQQAVWNQMRADDHVWFRLIKSKADTVYTPDQLTFRNELAFGIGRWCVLAYQMTGDPAYGRKAWAHIQPVVTGPLTSNNLRETFIEFVMAYDWLYPVLTEAERDLFLNGADPNPDVLDGLNGWAKYALRGFRVFDSDHTIGTYFGLALLDVAIDQTPPTSYLTQTEAVFRHNMGGLNPSGFSGTLIMLRDTRATIRDAIKWYVEHAEGGCWIESSEYNQGTPVLLMMGAEGVKTATGIDYFPEVTRWEKQAAIGVPSAFASDLTQEIVWGDDEHTKSGFLGWNFARTSLLGILAGVTQSDVAGSYVHGVLKAFVDKYGPIGFRTAQPYYRIFYFYNPYAASASLDSLPRWHYSQGMGFTYFRTGWNAAAAFFANQLNNRLDTLDHEQLVWGDFQLYRNEWVVTHPTGYGSVATLPISHNTMSFRGLASAWRRQPLASETAADGSYSYSVGTTAGSLYPPDTWHAPAEVIHEWTRSFFCIAYPGLEQMALVIYDRTSVDDPLTNVAGYQAYHRTIIESATGFKQWYLHTPAAPTITAEGFDYTTPGGQYVKVSNLAPLNLQKLVVDEKVLWPDLFMESEKAFHVRLSPNVEKRWDTFLNVAQMGSNAADVKSLLVRSEGGEAEGALVSHGGQPDHLVLFGAREGSRLHAAGFRVSWTTLVSNTRVHLADLDPNHAWPVTVDGVDRGRLDVSVNGLATLNVSGNGAHTLVLGTPVPAPPRILEDPVDAWATVGNRATFAVAVVGTPPLTFQWKKNGVVIDGATAAGYTTPPVVEEDERSQFVCIIANGLGSVTSNPAQLRIGVDPDPNAGRGDPPPPATPDVPNTPPGESVRSHLPNQINPSKGLLEAIIWCEDGESPVILNQSRNVVRKNLPAAGPHLFAWNGRNDNESNVSSGIYLAVCSDGSITRVAVVK